MKHSYHYLFIKATSWNVSCKPEWGGTHLVPGATPLVDSTISASDFTPTPRRPSAGRWLGSNNHSQNATHAFSSEKAKPRKGHVHTDSEAAQHGRKRWSHSHVPRKLWASSNLFTFFLGHQHSPVSSTDYKTQENLTSQACCVLDTKASVRQGRGSFLKPGDQSSILDSSMPFHPALQTPRVLDIQQITPSPWLQCSHLQTEDSNASLTLALG